MDAAPLGPADIAQLIMQGRVVRAGAWSRRCGLGGNVGRELNSWRSRREGRGATLALDAVRICEHAPGTVVVVGGRVVGSGSLFNFGADGYNGAWFVADG